MYLSFFLPLLQATIPEPGRDYKTWFLYVLVLGIAGLFVIYTKQVKSNIDAQSEYFDKALVSMEKQQTEALESHESAYKRLYGILERSLEVQLKSTQSIDSLTRSIQELTKQKA